MTAFNTSDKMDAASENKMLPDEHQLLIKTEVEPTMEIEETMFGNNFCTQYIIKSEFKTEQVQEHEENEVYIVDSDDEEENEILTDGNYHESNIKSNTLISFRPNYCTTTESRDAPLSLMQTDCDTRLNYVKPNNSTPTPFRTSDTSFNNVDTNTPSDQTLIWDQELDAYIHQQSRPNNYSVSSSVTKFNSQQSQNETTTNSNNNYYWQAKTIFTYSGISKKPILCCQDRFVTLGRWQVHLRFVHGGGAIFLCQACNSAFTHREQLVKHQHAECNHADLQAEAIFKGLSRTDKSRSYDEVEVSSSSLAVRPIEISPSPSSVSEDGGQVSRNLQTLHNDSQLARTKADDASFAQDKVLKHLDVAENERQCRRENQHGTEETQDGNARPFESSMQIDSENTSESNSVEIISEISTAPESTEQTMFYEDGIFVHSRKRPFEAPVSTEQDEQNRNFVHMSFKQEDVQQNINCSLESQCELQNDSAEAKDCFIVQSVYRCEFCENRFNTKRALKRHMIIYHKIPRLPQALRSTWEACNGVKVANSFISTSTPENREPFESSMQTDSKVELKYRPNVEINNYVPAPVSTDEQTFQNEDTKFVPPHNTGTINCSEQQIYSGLNNLSQNETVCSRSTDQTSDVIYQNVSLRWFFKCVGKNKT